MLLIVITLMTCASVIGRNTTGWTIVGDFELSGSAAGAAIALFMPWCQMRRGNIIVDFFTAGTSVAVLRARLTVSALFMVAAVMALMAWRTAIGGLSAWTSELRLDDARLSPNGWSTARMVPPLVLAALIGLAQAGARLRARPGVA